MEVKELQIIHNSCIYYGMSSVKLMVAYFSFQLPSVGGLDVYIRCGSVRFCCSALTGLPGAGTIDLRAAS